MDIWHIMGTNPFVWKSRGEGKSANQFSFSKISSLVLKQIHREVVQLQSFPILTLAAALVPPFTNFSPNAVIFPSERSLVEAHKGLAQTPCEIERRGGGPCSEHYFNNLALSRKTVEPKTGIEFPTSLYNGEFEESHSSLTPEVLVATGSKTYNVVRIKSVDIYAFGFYVHPFDVCEKLGPKYTSIPEYELNKRQDFYRDLLRNDINMTVRLVVSYNGIKISSVKSVFEKALRTRLKRLNPDADLGCLQEFHSMFSQDIPLHVGTTINFHRTADGHLVTEIGGNQFGAVRSNDLCRAFFDMYIGDSPICERTKEQIGKNVGSIIRMC